VTRNKGREVQEVGAGVELSTNAGQHHAEDQRHEEAGGWRVAGTGQSVKVRVVTLCCSTCLRGQLQSFCNVVTVNACSVAEVINVKILEDIFRNVEGNTKQLVDAGAVGQRSAISLSIIQVSALGRD
jgi:hypothetical protein